jgi:Ni,Fe-hydrogenase III large subunit
MRPGVGNAPRHSLSSSSFAWRSHGEAVARADVPRHVADEFVDGCTEECGRGSRIAAMAALPTNPRDPRLGVSEVLVVLADDARSRLGLGIMEVPEGRVYPALSRRLPQAQAFERELHEQHGFLPEGHPWLKPLRRHAALEAPSGPTASASAAPSFFKVRGEAIHELAVGPVHAGIIEPGHFRFQCHGERILHLELHLGYQHRGAEDLMLRSAPRRRLVVAESIAGDTAVGHALAHCMALESLAGLEPTLTAQSIRGIALELERIANHVGDLGALCGDVGYLPGAAWMGRLRGEFLNLLLELSGSRFGRSLTRPGGVAHGFSPDLRLEFLDRLASLKGQFQDVADLVFESPSVGARWEGTGVLTNETAEDLGLVGPAARASGCDRDVRRDHPAGIYRFAHVPTALADAGDVLSRALVRRLEVQRSIEFAHEQISELTDGALLRELPPARPESIAVSMLEGWRGEILHTAVTDDRGDFAAYKIVDPSFHNWMGLALAMRGGQVSDFPLCNKSFNLSYAGHDL